MPDNATVRQYSGSDANLMQKANVNCALLEENLADFTEKDPDVDMDFVNDYEDAITAAENVDSDELVEDVLVGKTMLVNAAHKPAADIVADVRYYAGKAFANAKEKFAELGLDGWDKARQSQTATLAFLKKLHTICTKHAAALATAGFGSARLTEILQVRQALEDADEDQERYRVGRPTLTAERIGIYNGVYERMVRVNQLAQIVYRDNYEKRKQFVFNPSGGGGNEEEYTGTVAPNELKLVAALEYDAARSLTMGNAGGGPIRFYLRVEQDVPSGSQQDVADTDDPVSVTMQELNPNPAAVLLMVENLGGVAAGYKVVVE